MEQTRAVAAMKARKELQQLHYVVCITQLRTRLYMFYYASILQYSVTYPAWRHWSPP